MPRPERRKGAAEVAVEQDAHAVRLRGGGHQRLLRELELGNGVLRVSPPSTQIQTPYFQL